MRDAEVEPAGALLVGLRSACGAAVRESGFRTLRKHHLPGSDRAPAERAQRTQRERDAGETCARPGAVRAGREALAVRQTRAERPGRSSRPLTAQVGVI